MSQKNVTQHQKTKLMTNYDEALKTLESNYDHNLGVIIDSHLTWYPQLDIVAKRARRLIWIFKRLRNVCDLQLMRYIYKTLVQSLLLYCISVWGGTFKTKFVSIERAQRSILKIMLGKSKFYSTEKIYKDTDLLTVRMHIKSSQK